MWVRCSLNSGQSQITIPFPPSNYFASPLQHELYDSLHFLITCFFHSQLHCHTQHSSETTFLGCHQLIFSLQFIFLFNLYVVFDTFDYLLFEISFDLLLYYILLLLQRYPISFTSFLGYLNSIYNTLYPFRDIIYLYSFKCYHTSCVINFQITRPVFFFHLQGHS